MKLYKLLFFNSMMFGTLITISSFSWFSMWLGLEINLLSIIPLFKSHNDMYPAEATLKYFITQVFASTIILFSIIMIKNMSDYLSMSYNYWMILSMNSALLMKLGVAPLHFWFIEVIEGLNWMNSLILLTWQKIAPMILISYNINYNMFFMMIILISSIVSGIFGLNQFSLRKIMAYSSINHMAWMLSSMMMTKNIWLIYFFIYCIISMNIIFLFYYFNTYYLNQLFLIMNSNKLIKMMYSINFFSIGGLPPFLGFLPKWLTINFLIENNFYWLSLMLIILTLLTLYFYMRIILSSLTLMMNENLNIKMSMNNFLIILINLMSIFGLLICTISFNLF